MSHGNSLRTALIACAVGLVGLMPATAQQVFKLDDSASPRSRVDARLEDSPLQQHSGPIVTVRFGRIDYRLTTSPYVGRRARIFFVVQPMVNGLLSPAGFSVQWQGGHLFANGTAQPGERRQVWTGVVRESFMGDTLDLSLELDARQLRPVPGSNLGFESIFEIELLP